MRLNARHKRKLLTMAVVLVIAGLGWIRDRAGGVGPVSSPPAANTAATSAVIPAAEQSVAGAPRRVIDDVEVKSHGKVIYRGRIDLGPTIDRIRAGEKFPHRNDGGVFGNRERRLPRQPSGYYREYVHPTRGQRGPGAQRLIVGRAGEWYYTADHYQSFLSLTGEP